MPFLFDRLYHRLGTKYFGLYVIFEVVSAFVVCLATVGLFTLYVETSAAELWRVAAVAELAVALAVALLDGHGVAALGADSRLDP
jgi:hypothetical protein